MHALVRSMVEKQIAQRVTASAPITTYICLDCEGNLEVRDGVWSCRGCSSRILPFSHLFSHGYDDLMEQLLEQVAPYMDPLPGRECPKCHDKMHVARVPKYLGAKWSGERVDICQRCEHLWLDYVELTGI